MTMEAAVNQIDETVGENFEAMAQMTTRKEAAVTQITRTMDGTIQIKIEGNTDLFEKLKSTTEKMEAILRVHAALGGPPPTEAQESKMEAVVAPLFRQMEQTEAKLEKKFEALEKRLDAINAMLISQPGLVNGEHVMPDAA